MTEEALCACFNAINIAWTRPNNFFAKKGIGFCSRDVEFLKNKNAKINGDSLGLSILLSLLKKKIFFSDVVNNIIATGALKLSKDNSFDLNPVSSLAKKVCILRNIKVDRTWAFVLDYKTSSNNKPYVPSNGNINFFSINKHFLIRKIYKQ